MIVNGFDINPQNGEAGTYEIGISPTSINEGIDRKFQVDAICGDKADTLTLVHEGMRQPFGLKGGGVFRVKGGGRFGVLKVGNPIEPPTPMETYTRLTYIECTGEQYINTGYVVQEDDVIEMQYITTVTTNSDKAMFGVRDDSGHLFTTIYSNTAYVRFGSNASVTVSNARQKYVIKLQKGSVDIDGTKATPDFNSMPSSPLYLFASNSYNNTANMYGVFKSTGFKITKSNGDAVMELKPCKRDSDGVIGMLDLVSGTFYVNQGSGADFECGGEARITEDYELMDYLAFNNDKIFDTGVYGNNNTYIEILFRRTDTSGADYIFGCSSGNRITGYLTSSGYWRYGSGYPTFNTNNKLLNYAYVTPGSTTVGGTTRTFSIGGAFTTAFAIPVGGHKPSSGVATPTYQGHLYFFRMWHGDEVVADFVPCRRLSDSVEGFWNCVTQTFVEPIS